MVSPAPLQSGHVCWIWKNPRDEMTWPAPPQVRQVFFPPPLAEPLPVHDLHATILALLGFDHTKLTYRYNGRDFRLTDVAGNVIKPILA